MKLAIIAIISASLSFWAVYSMYNREPIQIRQEQAQAERQQEQNIEKNDSVADNKKSEKAEKPVKKEIKPVHYTDNPEWSMKIENKGENREIRHGVAKNKVVFSKTIKNWKPGQQLEKSEITHLVKQVYRLMPHIKSNKDIINLVVETAIAESWGGKKAVKNRFADCGMFQIKAWVATETLNWLKFAHNDVYLAIMDLRNDKWTEEENLIKNLPYAAAMCVTCYWRYAGANFPTLATSLQKRAELWKSVYNTRKGAGTVNDYINRVNKYAS